MVTFWRSGCCRRGRWAKGLQRGWGVLEEGFWGSLGFVQGAEVLWDMGPPRTWGYGGDLDWEGTLYQGFRHRDCEVTLPSLPCPTVFTGPPDPLHGNSLYQKVRVAAQVSPGL